MISARRISAFLLLAVVPLASAQQAPRKVIKSASDLPVFSYPAPPNPARSEEAFRPIAQKLRPDIESLLRDYTIEDRSTLRGLHETLMSLDFLDNRMEEVRKEIGIIRDLEDKPAAKLMSGLVEEALLDSGATKPDPREFHRLLSAALNRLPWDVVGDLAKEWKVNFEMIGDSPSAGAVEMQNSAANLQTRQVNLARAQIIARNRFIQVIARPVKNEAIEAFSAYIAAHNAPKPDIWPARSVTLDAGAKAKPVVIGIWDTGVDRSLFQGRLAADGPVPGFDFFTGNPTNGELLAFDARQKEQWAQTKSLLKGSVDLEAGVDTTDASAFRKSMSTLKPEDMRPMQESMTFANVYIHGTHVAGIALEGNPFGRLAVVRLGWSYHVPLPPPTLPGIRKFAAGAGELTAYLRKQGARVVNMSWADTLGEFEHLLQANGVGADAAERRKMAQEMLGALREGVRAALASTPEILYVAAAGNTNSNTTFDEDIWASMKDLPNLLVAGAVDQAGKEASFTCFGPAVTVYSNGYQVESYIPGGERMKLSGTSMAAPNVTNLAAKLIALEPSLTPAEVIKLIRDGSDLSADGRFRLINPKRSVELLQARMR